MNDGTFIFNGVNGATGGYLLAPKSLQEIERIARGEAAARVPRFRPAIHGVDFKRLASTGWGVIFGRDPDPDVKGALAPLLEHRRAQATEGGGGAYRELVYWPGETARDFLNRQGAGPGVADPRRVPYYLLIIGSPHEIPFSFQYQLDLQYAVGRLWLESATAYGSYARTVVEVETGRPVRPRVALFAVRNDDDLATEYAQKYLVAPLTEHLAPQGRRWDLQLLSGRESSKYRLEGLLGGGDTPHLLFTSSHGLGFPEGDPRQLTEQGALLCGDWPGPRSWRGPIPKEFYFAADDIGPDVDVRGLVSFHFACHSAGTPRWSPLDPTQPSTASRIAPHDFLAALPRRLLGHPQGGALAVIGHVDRAWAHSFLWDQVGSQPQTFESALARMLEGDPVGYAMEIFNQRYADLSCDLLDLMESGQAAAGPRLASLWMARNDARNYVILGDPAARLPVAAEPGRTEARNEFRGGSVRRRVRRKGGAKESADPPLGGERRYTDITAPRRLAQGRRAVITVRLTRSPQIDSSAVEALIIDSRRAVEIHLHCEPGDFEILEGAVRRLAIEADLDTDLAVFYLRGLRLGERRLTLDFYQSGSLVDAVAISILVSTDEDEDEQRISTRPLAVEAGKPPLAPDLDLRVVSAVEGGHTVLRYILHSPSGAAPFVYQQVGAATIKGSPEQYQARLLERIESMTSQREMEALGNLLYEELFSGELRTAYRRFRHRVATLQVISDEPWIPWELVKPFDYSEPGSPVDDDFICARFQMTRWVAGWSGPAGELRVPEAACVEAAAPPGQDRLRYASEEKRYFSTGLLGLSSGVRDLSPDPATRHAVEELLDRGGIGLWHFSAHGDVNLTDPEESRILLADGWPLRPRDLFGRRQQHVSVDRPLVFLNACRIAQRSWSLIRLGGWAGAWVDRARCGAFIGPLWAVDDFAAYSFSRAFYEALRWGRTIGQAVKDAQQTVRDANPEDLTWLAYSVYAHPNAHVLLAPDEALPDVVQ